MFFYRFLMSNVRLVGWVGGGGGVRVELGLLCKTYGSGDQLSESEVAVLLREHVLISHLLCTVAPAVCLWLPV